MWVGTSCGDTAGLLSTRIHNIETTIDRTDATNGLLNIFHDYTNWDTFTSAFPAGSEATLASEGRIFLCNWTPKTAAGAKLLWADIAAGTYDASYVIPTATKMRDFGQPFFLVFHTEANHFSSDFGVTDTWGTSAQYVAAYQHVWNVFQSVGATNVVWVWNVTGYGFANMPLYQAIYPGDTYVDWGSFDPYSSGGSGGWEDYAYVTGTKYPLYQWWTGTHPTYNKTGAHDKPMMWQEWGAEEYNLAPNGGAYPNTKAGFFDQVHSGLRGGDYPLTKAIVYYNSTGGGGQNCIDSSSQALAAFKSLAADPFFNPDRSPTPPPPPGTIALRGASSVAINKAKTAGVPVPATAQAGDGLAVFLGVTRSALRNSCEGTNATSMTVANSGANGSNPVQVVTATAPQYDTSQKHSGSSSWHCSLTAGTDCHGDWTTNFGSPSTYYGRIYFRKSASPAAICRMFHQNSAANAVQWGIGLDTSGNLIVRDNAAAVTRLTMSTTITTNTWHRVEWKAVWTGSQTTVTVRLYLDALASETTLDEEKTSTTFAQAAAPGNYKFGLIFSAANTYDLYVDDFGLDTTDWLGPAGTPAMITAPGSLAQLGTDTNVAGSIELLTQAYRKTVASGDPGSTLTFTTDVEVHGSVVLVCWSGTDQTALEDVIAVAQRQSSGTTVTSPNVTSTVASDWIITAYFDRALAGSAATSVWTPPTGDTLRASSYGTGTDGRVAGGVSDDGVGHAVGTYGSKVATANATSFLASAWTLAIRPAAAASSSQHCGFLVHPA
jgi:hypothetical protein